MKATRVPKPITPASTEPPPTQITMPVPIEEISRIKGINSAEAVAALTAWRYIFRFSSMNSERLASSRTRVLVVLAPWMPSPKLLVIMELKRRTWRKEWNRLTWNRMLMKAISGSSATRIKASFQDSENTTPITKRIRAIPHTRSTIPQATMSPRREMSDVRRATIQPVGVRS